MKIQLYFAPGACSFVPHVALEIVKAATGQDFELKLVKLHKEEHQTPDYLAINADAQVPSLLVDAKPLTQVLAICDWLDRTFPQAGLMPTAAWAHAQALRQLAWMNNTAHPTFRRIMFPARYAESEAGRAEVHRVAVTQFHSALERIQGWIETKPRFWMGDQVSFHDAYAFTLLRWGGYAGIDPKSLPAYLAYAERVMEAEPVKAVMARERIQLDTYNPA